MKRTIITSILAVTLVGCATQSHQVATTDTSGNKTVTTDKSSQSDNAALTVVGQGVKIVGDVVTAVLPPLVPVIVSGLTHPVTSDASTNAAK